MTTITESGAGSVTATGSKLRIRIIDAGRGSSGIYPAEALREAATARVFAKGTHLYMDHPGVEETYDRPERSVKDLAAVLESDAEWNAEANALEADAKVFAPYREAIAEMAEHIGVSIRAQAEVDESSGAPVIKRITHAESIDFVTKAGRGGKVLQVLESARQATVREATATDVEGWLERAVQAAHGGGERGWVYVRDHDDQFVYYRLESPELASRSGIFRQPYSLGDGDVTLTGTPVEVNAETVYKPVTAPGDTPPPVGTTTESHQEDQMPNIQEGKPNTVSEADRIKELEDTVQESRTVIEAGKAEVRKANQTAAELVVAEAFDGIDAPKARTRLIEAAVAEAGHTALDAEALAESAREAAAEFAVSQGAGRPTGLGATTPLSESGDVSDDDIITALTGGN